jgi:hypothetical protein
MVLRVKFLSYGSGALVDHFDRLENHAGLSTFINTNECVIFGLPQSRSSFPLSDLQGRAVSRPDKVSTSACRRVTENRGMSPIICDVDFIGGIDLTGTSVLPATDVAF